MRNRFDVLQEGDVTELTTGKTPGHPRVLVVDVTRDRDRVEHRVTTTLCDELRKRGVDLTENSPAFAADTDQYSAVFDSTPTFNCLLLVAHGGPDPNDDTVTEVDGPPGVTDWYSLAALSENLQEKFVMLAVCYGYCADAISAFTQEDSWALSLLASPVLLSGREAIAFFPNFLEELSALCPENIDPVQIQQALVTNNVHSGNKMKLFSEGLPV